MINKIYSFFFEKPYLSTETKEPTVKQWEEEFRKAETGTDRLERFFSMKNAELIVHQLVNEYEDDYGTGFMTVHEESGATALDYLRDGGRDVAKYGFRNFVDDYVVPAVASEEKVSEEEAARKVREDLGRAYMNVVENIRRDANMEDMRERAPELSEDVVGNAADVAEVSRKR